MEVWRDEEKKTENGGVDGAAAERKRTSESESEH